MAVFSRMSLLLLNIRGNQENDLVELTGIEPATS